MSGGGESYLLPPIYPLGGKGASGHVRGFARFARISHECKLQDLQAPASASVTACGVQQVMQDWPESGAMVRSRDLLRTISVDRGITAPRSAT